MGVVKIKEMEGEVQDIKDLLQEHKVDVPAYLGVPAANKSVPIIWFVIIVPIFLILSSLEWTGVLGPASSKICILILFFLCSLIVLITHYNYKNWPITTITSVFCLIIILLALNVYSPQEIAKKIETQTVNKLTPTH